MTPAHAAAGRSTRGATAGLRSSTVASQPGAGGSPDVVPGIRLSPPASPAQKEPDDTRR